MAVIHIDLFSNRFKILMINLPSDNPEAAPYEVRAMLAQLEPQLPRDEARGRMCRAELSHMFNFKEHGEIVDVPLPEDPLLVNTLLKNLGGFHDGFEEALVREITL